MSIPTYIDLSESNQITQLWGYMKTFQVDIDDEPTLDTATDMSSLIKGVGEVWVKNPDHKALEGMVNSVISLLFTIPVDKVGSMVKDLCEKLEAGASVEDKASLSFKLLNILFSGYPIENPFLFEVYCSWIKVAEISKEMLQIPCALNEVALWVQYWGLTENQRQFLYRLLYDSHYNCGHYKVASEIMIELLGSFTKENAEQASDDAIKCIRQAIMDKNMFVFDDLLNLLPVKLLEGKPVHKLLTIFVTGNIQDYMKFNEENPDFIKGLDLCHESNIRKMRLLTLVDVIGSKREVNYDDIIEKLEVDEDSLEEIILDAVFSNLIKGRIDENSRKLIASQACKRSFTSNEWKELSACLACARRQLTSVCDQLNSLVSD